MEDEKKIMDLEIRAKILYERHFKNVYNDLSSSQVDCNNDDECKDLNDMFLKLIDLTGGASLYTFDCKNCWSYNKLCFGGCRML